MESVTILRMNFLQYDRIDTKSEEMLCWVYVVLQYILYKE
jgi:hypothetical protein